MSRKPIQCLRYCLLISVAGLFPVASPGQVAPGLGYVFPPAIERGKAADVDLGGFEFTPDLQFFVLDPTITLKTTGELGPHIVPEPPYWFGLKGFDPAYLIPRLFPAQINVPADHAAGLVHWQGANANGASSTAVFFVSDRKEVVENRFRDDEVFSLTELPIGVSGQVRKISEVDRYRFTATKTGPVTLELMARRLGANFNAVLEVRDETGKLIIDAADTMGRDVAITFAATAQQRYTVRVFDMDFRGNRAYVYRLAVTEAPRVVTTVPAFGKAGETREVDFIGYGVATGGDQLESVRAAVAFDAAKSRVAFGEQRVISHVLATKFGDVAVEIPISNLTELIETQATALLPAPCAVTGTLATASEVDRFKFAAVKDASFAISLESQAFGTRLDVSLDIEDAAGTVVATNDDANAASSDAGLTFLAKADGEYTCVVRDGSGQAGGSGAVYRLSVEAQVTPGFSLTCDQRVSSAIPGKAALKLKAIRTGNFTGAIPIRIEGLPAGVVAPEALVIPEKTNDLTISLDVKEDAAALAAIIRVTGTAEIDGQKIERVAWATTTGNLCPTRPELNSSTSVLLTTTLTPPFSLLLVDRNRQRAVNRGTTYPAPFQIQREEKFKGEIFLAMAAKQSRHRQGITGPILTVAPDQADALYPCFMPEWLATDKTTRMEVVGFAQVADPKGNLRYVTKNADARVTMILEGRLMKVAQDTHEMTIKPGDSFQVPVSLARTSLLSVPVKIELVVPPGLEKLVTAASVEIPVDADAATLTVQTVADDRLVGDWELTVKGTGLQDGRWPVITQTELPLRFVSSAKTASR